MNGLDRIIKKQRKARYKRLRKLFKARDMASKYVKPLLTVKRLDEHLGNNIHDYYFTADLAKKIVDNIHYIVGFRASRPPIIKKIK